MCSKLKTLNSDIYKNNNNLIPTMFFYKCPNCLHRGSWMLFTRVLMRVAELVWAAFGNVTSTGTSFKLAANFYSI